MSHPLIDAILEVGAAGELLVRRASVSSRERDRMREALAQLRLIGNEVFVNAVANGYGEVTVEHFQEFLKRCHEAGLPYNEMVAAFHAAQGTDP